MSRRGRTGRRSAQQLEELENLDASINRATPVRNEPRPENQAGISMNDLLEALSQRRESRKDFKPPQFNGDTDLEVFIKQFNDVSIANRWNEAEKSLHLRLSLSGKAATCSVEDTTEAITVALRNQFGLSLRQARDKLKNLRQKRDQSLQELSTDVNRLIKIAYPSLNPTERLDMAMDAFISALDNLDMQRNIQASKPANLMEAIQAAEEFIRLGKNSRSRLSAISEEEGKPDRLDQTLTVMKEMMSQQFNAIKDLTQALMTQQNQTTPTYREEITPAYGRARQERRPIKCFECQGPHMKRNCPRLKPTTATNQTSENYQGPAQ